MEELIKITTNDEGKQLVSARELYKGLGLARTKWTPWYTKNIIENEFFKENIDWTKVSLEVTGNLTTDFAISIEFAKHIAMMARTEKSHQYRNYFIECEKKAKNPYPQLSKELQAIFVLDERTQRIEKEIEDIKENSMINNYECEQVQNAVKKKGSGILGGKGSVAYQDRSTRTKVYTDIQFTLKRNFGITSYKALKRKQLDKALQILEEYKVPVVLEDKINELNNQIKF